MKYKLLKDEAFDTPNGKVYRIICVKTFTPAGEERPILEGTLGGFVHSDTCIPHTDNSWVFDNSMIVNGVLSNSCIYGGSVVYGGSYNNSIIKGSKVRIYGTPYVSDSILTGTLSIFDSPEIQSSKIRGGMIKGDKTKVVNSVMDGHCGIRNTELVNSKLEQYVVINDSVVDNCTYGGTVHLESSVRSNEVLTKEPILNVESVSVDSKI